MGGTRRRPRCRGDSPVSPYPIDRRLRLCARVGTQHLFVVVRRRSCVVSGVGSAATCGGARRAGAARAARSAACVCVVLPCGCGRCCGGACVATLAMPGVHAVESARAAAACVLCAGCQGGGRLACPSCERGVALLRERRWCAPPVPVLKMPLMPPEVADAVAAAESPLC